METPPEHLHDLQALQALITSLSPEWRVKTAAMLSDAKMRGWLVAVADASTAELTSEFSYADVAERLGVSVAMVNRRISRHNKRRNLPHTTTIITHGYMMV